MKLPIHLKMTEREFRRQKRVQFNNLCRYIDITDIRLACTHLPADQYLKLAKGIDLIFEARKELRPWWNKA